VTIDNAARRRHTTIKGDAVAIQSAATQSLIVRLPWTRSRHRSWAALDAGAMGIICRWINSQGRGRSVCARPLSAMGNAASGPTARAIRRRLLQKANEEILLFAMWKRARP